ncbi:transposase [Rhodoblastus acidophilus]|jgi:transposase|uniref:Transposase n=1 Tax=Candidatus Rhodoblastus alkanivorans TaxID=2954117 RepID=A0ABS9Z7L4_9HYPH|nr:transposase [Candidatus Rhodoblastus alkanivorans]MCI4680911.1 transposase [Candidatus Rhodoblastus alkanivorans]MCI4683370.1 transposase [Candidatus Rhodoblastus alkanivorans]MCI4684983.1 transposase [Candidatus Rhodoblastus alkanivorans]MDI4643107.1 transposase [Rhodoblastus acidophilus]
MHSHTHSVEKLAIVETGRRRRWSDEEKLRIVSESMAGPRLVSATARRHGISPGQLFTWRRELRVQPQRPAIEPPQMVRVCVEAAPKASGSPSMVEIILPSGVRLVVASDIDPVALRRIMNVMAPR